MHNPRLCVRMRRAQLAKRHAQRRVGAPLARIEMRIVKKPPQTRDFGLQGPHILHAALQRRKIGRNRRQRLAPAFRDRLPEPRLAPLMDSRSPLHPRMRFGSLRTDLSGIRTGPFPVIQRTPVDQLQSRRRQSRYRTGSGNQHKI